MAMSLGDHSTDDLVQVADALSQGRLTAPFSAVGIARLGVSNPQSLSVDLISFIDRGLQPVQLAILLREIVHQRQSLSSQGPTVELVVTGPDSRKASRDTAVVVEQLFAEVQRSVLLVGFALYKGDVIFRSLAERLDATPTLDVKLCLDISRRGTDTTRDQDLIARFAREFVEKNWSGQRRPKVYFDPRGLTMDAKARAVLHAKCIVIDNTNALITSANPTPAAYDRNIEIGVVVRGGSIPQQIANHFSSLIETGALRELYLPSV
jgi:phosphatidylserine/phosphatidylglycerophosphate/cardiolipin synthase-like enzyme